MVASTLFGEEPSDSLRIVRRLAYVAAGRPLYRTVHRLIKWCTGVCKDDALQAPQRNMNFRFWTSGSKLQVLNFRSSPAMRRTWKNAKAVGKGRFRTHKSGVCLERESSWMKSALIRCSLNCCHICLNGVSLARLLERLCMGLDAVFPEKVLTKWFTSPTARTYRPVPWSNKRVKKQFSLYLLISYKMAKNYKQKL